MIMFVMCLITLDLSLSFIKNKDDLLEFIILSIIFFIAGLFEVYIYLFL